MLSKENTDKPAANIVKAGHRNIDPNNCRRTKLAQHQDNEAGEEGNIDCAKHAGRDVSNPRRRGGINEAPHHNRKNSEIEGHGEGLGAKKPRADHHADCAKVQGSKGDMSANPSEGSSQLPQSKQSDAAHEADKEPLDDK